MNNSGDDIYVKNRTLTPPIADVVTYGDASGHVDQSYAAIPNGSDNFDWRAKTFCATNGGAGDFIPPSAVSDLAAAPGAFPGEIRLTWTAPGDDGANGTASAYVIKTSLSPIDNVTFAAAPDINFWTNEPLPHAAATPETLYVFGFDPGVVRYFALKAIDDASNVGAISNVPNAGAQSGSLLGANLGYNVYYGNLHSHTSYSDGEQTPADAYAFARSHGLDFLAVSDHNHVSAGMQLPNYALGLSQAAAANDDGNFVAIYGQEWGLSSNGHTNIFEAPVLFGWDAGNYDVFVAEGDYPSLYTAVRNHPSPNYPPVMLWCHPASSDFSNYQMSPDALAVVHLMCLVNGPAFSTKTDETDIGNTGYDDVFQAALKKGFHVSPTGDQDNHHATWGMSTQSRTGVFASAKTKLGILTALSQGRNFATQDHNARLDVSADGHAMGESFTTPNGIRIAAHLSDPDAGESVATYELYAGVTGQTNATLLASSVGSADFQWRELRSFPEGTTVHYYLRVREADNQRIWSAPFYVTYGPVVDVADHGLAAPRLELHAPVPNPTAGATDIAFSLPRGAGFVRLSLFDAGGRRVRDLIDGALPAGDHHVTWDGRLDGRGSAGPGIYFARLDAGRLGSTSTKVIVLK
ncbi:MAG: CehA/McbA family metallohydrolase [Candidatus Eisenbacteria bacterium]